MYECRGDGKELYFYYDSYGNLSAIRYISSIGDYYYFVTTNKQGDVLGLYSENGNLKVSYEYDTWGNCTVKDASGNAITSSIHIGNVNPIRYRGYYYDNDLGLYYLQSRYYDSTIGRFINADGYVTTGQGILSYNMFAYCMNNPVMYSDPSGKSGILGLIIAYFVVATGIVVAGAICAEKANNNRENQSNYRDFEQELEDSYTDESAIDASNDIVDKYSDNDTEVYVELTDEGIHIENSYLVTSKYDRQKVSEIWSRTNVTNRSYDSLSAEWKFHNDLYSIFPESKWKTQAKHADLDFVRDRRFYVYYPSLLYEEIGWD